MVAGSRPFASSRSSAWRRVATVATRQRHAAFYLLLADEAEPNLLGPQQRQWLERLDAELDNIRAALGWARSAGEAEMGLRIGAELWRFWQLRNHELEARGDRARARVLFKESLAVHRDLGDAWGVSNSLSDLSFLAPLEAGDTETARTLLAEALAIERESGHQPRLANALEMSARLAASDGQAALATRLYACAALPR